ncbi:MAG: ABC transporter ATP-binding protein [Parvibaculum sp.]|uniref:ABC transporter ATP-binding protein n=1 Tax=Parvibaculum sp. TaxID=2024848 RepID=UPI003C725B2C
MRELGIELHHISKTFKVYDRPVDMMWEILSGRRRHREFEALKDISLSIEKGSVVGIIGRNGAGKSTLLRIIARTLNQSSGDVRVNGRISAILELGTGFNPDYSGRDNIYLGGLCLGLTRQKISEREADIIAFSELEDFIDQPFKTYSSGMQARLTFSVAVSVDPDILIVDEALSVGDAKFQLKSFDRIAEFKRLGKTILVVSHDINTLAAFCDRAILLDRGKVISDGRPNSVGRIYHELLFSNSPLVDQKRPSHLNGELEKPVEEASIPASVTEESVSVRAEHRYGTGAVNISDVAILDANQSRTTLLDMFGEYHLRVVVDAQEDVDEFVLGLLIRTPRGIEVVGTDSGLRATNNFPQRMLKGKRYDFGVKFTNNLAPGEFFLTCGIARPGGEKLDFRFDCLSFRVTGKSNLYASSLAAVEFRFSCQQICEA